MQLWVQSQSLIILVAEVDAIKVLQQGKLLESIKLVILKYFSTHWPVIISRGVTQWSFIFIWAYCILLWISRYLITQGPLLHFLFIPEGGRSGTKRSQLTICGVIWRLHMHELLSPSSLKKSHFYCFKWYHFQVTACHAVKINVICSVMNEMRKKLFTCHKG